MTTGEWNNIRTFHNALHNFIRHTDTLDWSSNNPCACEWRLDIHIDKKKSYLHVYMSIQEPNEDFYLRRYLMQRDGDYIMSPNEVWLILCNTSIRNETFSGDVIHLKTVEDIQNAYEVLSKTIANYK